MGEPSEAQRDADTLALLRYGLSQFRERRVLDVRRPVTSLDVEYRDDRVQLVPARGLSVTVRRGQRVRRRFELPDELDGPMDAGERVGTVSVYVGGRRVGRVGLRTATEVPGAGPVRVLTSFIGLPLTLLVALVVFLAAALRIRAVAGRKGAG
jgi:D-alanyl-D-alanine carboxypeptidase (penicillin-binding protein 5/6)